MSIVISGAFIIITFLLVTLVIFNTFLGTTATQGASLAEASDFRVSQVAGIISITSTNAVDSGGGTNITVVVNNPGSISYSNFSQTDLLVNYTNASGGEEVKRLSYICKQLCGGTGDPGDNQWTISGFSPDSYNPKMWDPDESATVPVRVVPVVKSGSQGTVALAMPSGVSDSAYFTN